MRNFVTALFLCSFLSFSVIAGTCPKKCNDSCGAGKCAKAACGCDDATTLSESAGNTGECTRYEASQRKSGKKGSGKNIIKATKRNVQKN